MLSAENTHRKVMDMPKVIKNGTAEAIKIQEEFCEHYKTKLLSEADAEYRQRLERRIYYLKLTIEALERLNAEHHTIDGRCPVCDRRFSEKEIKEFFFCPQCGQALINPEKHKDIIEEMELC